MVLQNLHDLLGSLTVLDLCGGEVLLPVNIPSLDNNKDGNVVHNTLLELRAGVDVKSGSPPTISALKQTIEHFVELLVRWATREQDAFLKSRLEKTAAAFKAALELVRDLEVMSTGGNASFVTTKFVKFLGGIVESMQKLPPGGLAVFPCGWILPPKSETSKELSDRDRGHAFFIIVVRSEIETRSDCTFAVVNAGEGLQYHPVQVANDAPNPGEQKRQVPFLCPDVPLEKLKSSSFWWLLYRQMVYPKTTHGPSKVYGRILPFLTQKPLKYVGASQAAHPWVDFVRPPLSDISFSHSAVMAVRFCLSALDVPPHQAHWAPVQLRKELLLFAQRVLPGPNEPLPSQAEIASVREACKSLARAAADHSDCFASHPDSYRQYSEVEGLIDSVSLAISGLEGKARTERSVFPPQAKDGCIKVENATVFPNAERLVRDEDMQRFVGEVEPERTLVPVLLSKLPVSVEDPIEAAALCRDVCHMLTLLANQQDQIQHSTALRFALVVHVISRTLR